MRTLNAGSRMGGERLSYSLGGRFFPPKGGIDVRRRSHPAGSLSRVLCQRPPALLARRHQPPPAPQPPPRPFGLPAAGYVAPLHSLRSSTNGGRRNSLKSREIKVDQGESRRRGFSIWGGMLRKPLVLSGIKVNQGQSSLAAAFALSESAAAPRLRSGPSAAAHSKNASARHYAKNGDRAGARPSEAHSKNASVLQYGYWNAGSILTRLQWKIRPNPTKSNLIKPKNLPRCGRVYANEWR